MSQESLHYLPFCLAHIRVSCFQEQNLRLKKLTHFLSDLAHSMGIQMPGYNLMMLTSPPVWLAKQTAAALNAQEVWTAEDIIFFRQEKTHGLVTEAWLLLRREDIQVETSDSVLAWVECGKIQQCRDSYPRPPWGLVLLCSCQRGREDVTHSMGKQPRVEEQNTHYSNHHIS